MSFGRMMRMMDFSFDNTDDTITLSDLEIPQES